MRALAWGGACIGDVVECDDQSAVGKKVFIHGTAPGEIVTAESTKEDRRFLSAELRAIESPSPDRVTPPCPYFGTCGGCDLQHLSIQAQREAKRLMVETMLARQSALSPIRGVTLLGPELPALHYRRRIALHVNDQGRIGFYRAGTGEVVDIEECLLARTEINDVLSRLRPLLPPLARAVGGVTIEHHAEQIFLVLRLRGRPPPAERASLLASLVPILSTFPHVEVNGAGEVIAAQEDGVPVAPGQARLIAAGHFSQVNEAANEVLVTAVLQHLGPGDVTDLYAGAGNFALPIARSGRSVEAVEVDPALVLQGSRASLEAGLPVTWRPMSCEQYLRRHSCRPVVVLDPPRAGAPAVASALRPATTPSVVYISCNLPTLARDLRVLGGNGYRLQQVFVLDMFAQTHHIETISVLIA